MSKTFLFAMAVIFLLFSSNALSARAEDMNCTKLFKNNCAECHGLERGCKRLGQSPKEWKELFEFMEGMGADIPKDEQELLLACLEKPDEGIHAECKK